MFKFLLLPLLFITNFAFASELRIIVSSTDDSYYINAQVFGKYYSKYLPEHPNIIIEPIPGAAGYVAANYLYNIAPRDGSVIGALPKIILFGGIVKPEQVKYDIFKMNWIGSTDDGRKDSIFLWSTSPVFKYNFIVGSEAAFAGSAAPFINFILHENFKIINGYPTPGANRLALERGEVEAVIYNLAGIKAQKPHWIFSNSGIYPLLQYGNGNNRYSEYPNVPTVYEYLTDSSDKELLSIYEQMFTFLRLFIAPPNVSKKRMEELINAFNQTISDPEYKEECLKLNIQLNPIYHQEISTIISSLKNINPDIIKTLNDIWK